jgi:hypothetical protein
MDVLMSDKDTDAVLDDVLAMYKAGADRETVQRVIDDYCQTLGAEQWLAHVSRLLEDTNHPLPENLANALRAARASVLLGASTVPATDTRH